MKKVSNKKYNYSDATQMVVGSIKSGFDGLSNFDKFIYIVGAITTTVLCVLILGSVFQHLRWN